jgi:hypothetical protein
VQVPPGIFPPGLLSLKTLALGHNRVDGVAVLTGLEGLMFLSAQDNRLTNISALANLPRLARANLTVNLLDLSLTSPTLGLIQYLQSRGVDVVYVPQNQPPLVTAPASRTLPTNALAALPFAVSDDTTPADQLLASASSSDPGRLNVVDVNGAGSTRTVTVTTTTNTGPVSLVLMATDSAGLSNEMTVAITVVAPPSVVIPDPHLEAALRSALGKPDGPLTNLDLASLTSLSLFAGDITNLSGLEAAVNLADLYLQAGSLSNITWLQHLSGLTSLALSGCRYHQVLSSTNLNDWIPLALLAPTNGPLLFLDSTATAPARFYRLLELTSSSIRFESVNRVGDEMQLVLSSPPALGLELQTSTDLWQWTVLEILTNSLGTVSYTHTRPTNSPARFYRARLLP